MLLKLNHRKKNKQTAGQQWRFKEHDSMFRCLCWRCTVPLFSSTWVIWWWKLRWRNTSVLCGCNRKAVSRSLLVSLVMKACRLPIWFRPFWMCETWISTLFWKQLKLEASIVFLISFNESVSDLISKEFSSPRSARHLICNKIGMSWGLSLSDFHSQHRAIQWRHWLPVKLLGFLITPPSPISGLVHSLPTLVRRRLIAVLLHFMQNFVEVLVELLKLQKDGCISLLKFSAGGHGIGFQFFCFCVHCS